MAKQPEFNKYLPLDNWFSQQPLSKTQLNLTFEQIEKILDASLPTSSIKPSWWTNIWPNIQSHRTAWLNHGWQVAEYDPRAQTVTFVRK